MKEVIKNVLYDLKDAQMNLASSSARETIATLITAALKANSVAIPKEQFKNMQVLASQYEKIEKQKRDDKWDELVRVVAVQKRHQ